MVSISEAAKDSTRIQHHGETTRLDDDMAQQRASSSASFWSYNNDVRIRYQSVNFLTSSNKDRRRLSFTKRRQWNAAPRTSTTLAPWLRMRVVLVLLLIPSLQAGLLLHQHQSISQRWRRPQQAFNPSFAVTSRRQRSISISSSLYAARSGGAAATGRKQRSRRSIATDDLTALKESVDIVSVVESYNLPAFRRTGQGNKATCLCPFHDDHSPSLKIDGERRIYKCFACGAGGDVYQFVRQYNNQVLGEEEMTFYQAVRFVSQNFGEQNSVAANNILSASTSSTGGKRRMSDEERKGLDHRKERIILANSAAAAFYSSCLTKPNAGGARHHLRSRALSVSTLRTFAIGYAPDAYFSGRPTRAGSPNRGSTRTWGDESLVQHLKSLGFTANEILDAGLALQTKRGLAASTAKARAGDGSKSPSQDNVNATTEIADYDTLIDRFRHRIMVPIFDSTGKNVIAFGGREIPSLEEETITVEVDDSSSSQWKQRQQEFKGPKYLNSPESPVFQKSHILFGQHLANAKINERLTTTPMNRKNDSKGSTASSDSLILVEGYMDVISLHTAGVNGVVASMGTAVTVEQLTLAAKLAISRRRALSGNAVNGGRLVLCLDNDAAGEATVERLCSQGMLVDAAARVQNAVEIVIATLPKGMKDPADFVEARLLSNDDSKDTVEAKEQLSIDFHTLVLENAQEWTDWYLQRLLSSFDPKALQGRPGSLGNVFDCVARFLATSMDTAGRTQKAYEIAGSFAATISNSTNAESSSSVRNQLEADLIQRAAKIADEMDASTRRFSRGYQQQPQQGGMLTRRNGNTNAVTADHGERTDKRRRNGTRTASTPKRRNGNNEQSPTSGGQLVSRDRASVPPLTNHVDGTFQCSKTDGDWMGLTKEGRLEPPLGFDLPSTIEYQLHEALIQGQGTTATPTMSYSQRRDARRAVYHNSNEYHGESFLTQEAELAGYTKGNINLQKYPELFENGVASLLVDVNPLLSLRNAEDAVLKALVSNGSARTIAKDWLGAKSAVNANMVDLKWTAPDKEWLFTCLVNEMDSIPHTCNNDPRNLRMFLSNRTDCPLTAFVTAEEETAVEDQEDDKPSSSSRLHERTSAGTLDPLFFRDDGLPVDLTDGTRPASIDLYMQEILGAHVLASTSCHAKVIRDELTHVATSLDGMANESNNSSDATTAQGANETTTQGEAELAMRFQELTAELRDVTATWREMTESMNRVNSRLMREKTGLDAEGRMSINAQMKLADDVDKFEQTHVVSPSLTDDDRYLPTDSASKEPLDDELQRMDEEFGEWANEDYVWTCADAEKDLRKNSHLYLMEMQDREEQRYEHETDNPQ